MILTPGCLISNKKHYGGSCYTLNDFLPKWEYNLEGSFAIVLEIVCDDNVLCILNKETDGTWIKCIHNGKIAYTNSFFIEPINVVYNHERKLIEPIYSHEITQ